MLKANRQLPRGFTPITNNPRHHVMSLIQSTNSWYQISYRLTGFDRLNFVSDVTNAIPQGDACQITQLIFEADGVQARGKLLIRVQQQQWSSTIHDRLRSVRGMVCVQTDRIH